MSRKISCFLFCQYIYVSVSISISIYIYIYPLERTVGSIQCKEKRCQTCHNEKETETFISTTTGKTFKINHKLNCNDKSLVYLLTRNVCLKQYVGPAVEEFRYRWNNYKKMVVNIKSMAHVCRNTFLNIFLRRDTMVFWNMSLLHWLTKPTHQTLYREKITGEVFWRQWRHGDWTLNTVSEIAFWFILTTKFVRIVIRTWFTQTILIPIINVPTFITIIAVPVFMTFL